MKNDSSIGLRLRIWADDAINLTHQYSSYKQIAEFLNIHPSRLSDYFRGKNKMSANILQKLQEMGCDIRWLLNKDSVEIPVKEMPAEEKKEGVSLTYSWYPIGEFPGKKLLDVKAEWVKGFEGILAEGDKIGVNLTPYIIDRNDLVLYEAANITLVRIVHKSAAGIFLSAPGRNDAIFPEVGCSILRIEAIFKKIE